MGKLKLVKTRLNTTLPLAQAALERLLIDHYGLLLTQRQLADLLGRSPAGLRWSLAHPRDPRTLALRAAARRVGRRRYYPAAEVAAILAGVE